MKFILTSECHPPPGGSGLTVRYLTFVAGVNERRVTGVDSVLAPVGCATTDSKKPAFLNEKNGSLIIPWCADRNRMPYEESPENEMSLPGPSLLGAVRLFGSAPLSLSLKHKMPPAGA